MMHGVTIGFVYDDKAKTNRIRFQIGEVGIDASLYYAKALLQQLALAINAVEGVDDEVEE